MKSPGCVINYTISTFVLSSPGRQNNSKIKIQTGPVTPTFIDGTKKEKTKAAENCGFETNYKLN